MITAPLADARAVARRAAVKHLRDRDERLALCGTRLRGVPASPGADPCVVCLDLARRDFVTR